MARRHDVMRRCAVLVLALASVIGVTVTQTAGDAVDAAPSHSDRVRLSALDAAARGNLDSLAPAIRVAPPERRVLMVGDSTLAAVRNATASHELFVGFEPVLDAQGCRRLVWPSCWSDSDLRVPNTIEEAILGTPGVLDVVVVMSGHNDWHDPFGSFVDTIMAAARSKGAQQVVWLTLSTGRWPGSSATAIGVYAENTMLLWQSAPRHPDLVIADWRTYNQRSTGWMHPDGVHLEPRGAFGLADYISRWIAHLDGRPCTAPLEPGGVVHHPCPDPNTMTRVPDIARLYGV
ncbi:MAG: hypothetical protein ACE37B_21140 [Ilumatobacter sp.]|uniref:hypothetical protein n=1 Tax=Ilumatobacter sp. TaxID=1967498 RepID=UPI00391BA523